MSKPNKGNPRCNKCGFRIRGKNHNEGTHHQKGRRN